MPLNSGTTLGPYEIAAQIGAGGMGEVYRAHDSRVDRDVAIKVSNARFSERFQREAHAIAALNHPNICTLYDVGPDYLVMELVEGESPRGPLPLEEVLRIGRQIAAALESAHERGITHRDLKPANIRVKADGTVKVLDFGLATLDNASPTLTDNSPTMISPVTEAGVVLGTAGYMAPEQVNGKSVDKRADIWAFGVVVYELITGRRPFRGDTVTETLAATLKEEPQWDAVPPQLRPLLRRCLEKDPRRRLRDIGDAMPLTELQNEQAVKASHMRFWPVVAAVAVLGLLLIPTWLYFDTGPVSPLVPGRFSILPPERLTSNGAMALSPDARRLAFVTAGPVGGLNFWVRTIETGDTRQLAVKAGDLASLFWSSDSEFLLVQPGFDQKLHKIDMLGGPPQVLCDAGGYVTGGAWTDQGVIVFGSSNGPLMRFDPGARAPEPLTKLDLSRDETNHSWPVLLRGTNNFLYLRITRDRGRSGLFAGSLEAKPDQQSTRQILETRWGVTYVPPRDSGVGTLLFRRDGALMMQPFDPEKLELLGEPTVVAQRVGAWNTYSFFSASQNGHLIYRVADDAVQRFSWLDRMGKTLDSRSIHGYGFALSPDNSQVVFEADGNQGLMLLNFERGTTQRFTTGGRAASPVWFRDKRAIAYSASPHGVLNIYKKPTDGGAEELLWESTDNKLPTSISSDGRLLLYTAFGTGTGNDLWVLPIGGTAKPIRQTQFSESEAQLSPNGPYIAYESNENGTPNIYLQEFSVSELTAKGAPVPVSTKGGTAPRWNGDGTELFYRSEGRLFVVNVATSGRLQVGIPAALPVVPGGTFNTGFSVAADGKRFLFHYQDVPNAEPTLSAIWNWH